VGGEEGKSKRKMTQNKILRGERKGRGRGENGKSFYTQALLLIFGYGQTEEERGGRKKKKKRSATASLENGQQREGRGEGKKKRDDSDILLFSIQD